MSGMVLIICPLCGKSNGHRYGCSSLTPPPQQKGTSMHLSISKEWFEKRVALEADHEIGAGLRACNCIGPQNGQPVCPCAMSSVAIENGRYVQRNDLGPISKG